MEEARWAVEKASERLEKGDAEGALKVLEQAQRLHPPTPGLPELLALAQVCHVASCSAAPHWSRILMVSEKDDLTAIRKRYLQLALLLHPDKNKHARAEEAFKLVSEAYGHLSDGNERETSDLNIRRKESGKCSFEFQPSCWDSMRCNGEPLRGKVNQTDFQGCYFPFPFHTAEWKIEHEKLRMFRERAQAKVDSLAQVLKERRSKWNEEFGSTKGRLKKKSCYNSDERGCPSEVFNHRSRHAAEKKVLYDKLHASGGDQNGASKKAGASFLNAKLKTLFVDKMSEKGVGSRKQDPPVLQSLHELLRIVNEEMGDIFNVSFEGTADAKAEDKQQSRETQAHEINIDAACVSRNPWVSCGCSNNAQGKKKLEEEWIVIDDFLAALNENGRPLSASTGGQTCERKCATAPAGPPSSSFVRRYSREAVNDVEACIASLKEQPPTPPPPPPPPPPLLQQASKCTLDRVCLEAPVLEQPWNNPILSSACAQNKQSEQQLLRTFERLRDETQSVAESMKEARILPGNYHVPIAT